MRRASDRGSTARRSRRPFAPRGSVPDTTAATRPRRRRRAQPIVYPAPVPLVGGGGHLSSGSDVLRAGRPAADRAGRSARQRARCHGGASAGQAAGGGRPVPVAGSAADSPTSICRLRHRASEPRSPTCRWPRRAMPILTAAAAPWLAATRCVRPCPACAHALAGRRRAVPAASRGSAPSGCPMRHCHRPRLVRRARRYHAPAGDDADYYFLTEADPAPQLAQTSTKCSTSTRSGRTSRS